MKSYREVYGIFKEKSDRWTKIIYCPLLFDAQKILLDTPMHLVHIYYSDALVVPKFYRLICHIRFAYQYFTQNVFLYMNNQANYTMQYFAKDTHHQNSKR